MKKKTKTTVSSSIVNFLWKEESMKHKEICAMMDLSESFISHVAKGERNLRLEHLVSLEKSLGIPFPWLILIAHYKKSITKKQYSSYKTLLRIGLEEWRESQNKKSSKRKCRKK
jgi:transcriptional regulator with XRE-family HTH domain